MHYIPKKTIDLIIETANHYIAQVKGNQPKLYQGIQQAIVDQKPLSYYEEHEKGHGRDTSWYVSVYNALDDEKAAEWKGLSRFIQVHRVSTSQGIEVHSDRLYISDLYHSDAGFFHKGIRGHWGIENRLHYVKDVVHQEDGNQIKTSNGPVNAAVLSTIAMNIHRKNGNDSIKYGQIKFRARIKSLFELCRT